MIWSIMPEESLFSNDFKDAGLKEVMYRNRRVLATPLPNGKMRVQRLLSSNPRDFLDDKFAPGAIIDFYHS